MELAAGFSPEWVDVLELIQGYWREVGVDMQVRPIERSLWYDRVTANLHDATVWVGDGGVMPNAMIYAHWYLPGHPYAAYASLWGQWRSSGGELGEEPPEATQQQYRLHDQLQATIDPEARDALMAEILDIAQEEFYALGISLNAEGYGIVKNTFHNVPEVMIGNSALRTPAYTNPQQYFIERSSQSQ